MFEFEGQSSQPPLVASAALGPARPTYILRGHSAPIHSVHFFQQNTRLITADAEGWVVVWDMNIKRPIAVWKAHTAALLGTCSWGAHRIITHGRDNKIYVWDLDPSNVPSTLSTALPVEGDGLTRTQPWMLHALDVNSLNFCGFAICADQQEENARRPCIPERALPLPVLIAVPSSLDSDGIDIFQLPSERRIDTINASPAIKTGMVMALLIFHHLPTNDLLVAAGYESGHTMLFHLGALRPSISGLKQSWTRIYMSHAHSQPGLDPSPHTHSLPPENSSTTHIVLSLALHPQHTFYITSSADALLAKHLVSTPTTTSSAPVPADEPSKPSKVLNTHHAGQEGLAIRSDGKIFATGGWDRRARVYSTKGGMRELAVLKWHTDGVFRVAFGELPPDGDAGIGAAGNSTHMHDRATERVPEQVVVAAKPELMSTEEEARDRQTRTTHWLAVGAKDGKVSLWDLY